MILPVRVADRVWSCGICAFQCYTVGIMDDHLEMAHDKDLVRLAHCSESIFDVPVALNNECKKGLVRP